MGSMGDQNRASEPAARSDARDSAKTKGSEPSFEDNATRHVARRGARRCLLTASLVACLIALIIVSVPVIAATSPKTRRWADPNEVKAGEASETQREEIRSFFSSLDADGDGQVRGDELGAYVASSVGGKDFDTDVEVADAVRAVQERIDGQDTGDAIDAEELMVSLTSTKNQMLRPHKVARWVRHGPQLPPVRRALHVARHHAAGLPGSLGRRRRRAERGTGRRERAAPSQADPRAQAAAPAARSIARRTHGRPSRGCRRGRGSRQVEAATSARPPAGSRVRGAGQGTGFARVARRGDRDPRGRGRRKKVTVPRVFVTPTREMAAAAHAAGVGNGRVVPMRFRVVAWGGHGGGVSDESASVEMKPLRKSRRSKEVRGDGRVESDWTPAGNSIVAGSNPRDAGWSATLLGSLYSALGTFLIAAGIATRFALNGASFVATRGVQFLLRRPKSRRDAADSGAHEPPPRQDEATANNGDEDRASPPPSAPLSSHPNGGGRGFASPQPRYDRARVLESAMAAAVAAGVADASDEAILSSPSAAAGTQLAVNVSNGASANGSFCASDDDDDDRARGLRLAGCRASPRRRGGAASWAARRGGTGGAPWATSA